MSKKAFIFPGQGSQYVGMAEDLYNNSAEAKEMITSADSALGISLSEILFKGPEEKLKQSEYTQPAIFLHSVVLAAVIRKIQADAAAGHSVGEYSALVAAGYIDFTDAVKLVRERGLAMTEAGIKNPGTMAAIIGIDFDKVDDICREASKYGIVQPANYNSPGQVVISGSSAGVQEAMKICRAGGAKLVKELQVSGAFHSPLMKPAQEKLKSALERTGISGGKFPVYSNVTSKPFNDHGEVRNLLFEQLTAPVPWAAIINNMINDGVQEFYEIGPGKVLQGLMKRINPDVPVFGIDKFTDLERYL